MRTKICGFCGHRDCGSSIRELVKAEITNLIENSSITDFYSGGMGAFDRLCENTVRELKRENKDIRLYLIAPYLTQKINREGKYYLELYDDVIIPDLGDIHYKRTITERNKWIVEKSDVLLCYVTRSRGGAYRTMQYAQKLGKTIRKLERGEVIHNS